jgi:hypothetical protein
MPATFSWYQFVGSSGNSTTPAAGTNLTPTSSAAAMSWDFETADSTGTSSYTANPVSAGSNSYPVWLKGYFSNSVGYTISNVKFWQFNPATNSANTNTFAIFGTVQANYSVATGTATGTAYASNVQVPTSANSTASPGSPLTMAGSVSTSAGNSLVTQSYIALQLTASSAAPAGTSGYFGFTMQYDEQ